jgi:hypothetical protein
MSTIPTRFVRNVLFRGQRVETGTVLKLSPLEAAQALENAAGELVRPDDLAACQEATRADVRAMLREAARVPLPAGPWLPAGQHWQ